MVGTQRQTVRDWRNGKHPPVRGLRRKLYEITGLACFADAANWKAHEEPCRKIGEEKSVPLLAELVVRCGLPTREVKQIRLSQRETDGSRLAGGRFIRFGDGWEKVNRASFDAWVERAGPTNYLFYLRKPVDRNRPASAQWIAKTLRASGVSLQRSRSTWLNHSAGDFARLGQSRKGFLHHLRSVHGLSKGGAATAWQGLRDRAAFARAEGRELSRTAPESAYAALYPAASGRTSATRPGVGGRKKLADPDRRFFQIGLAVDEAIPRCQRGLEILRKLKREHPTDRVAWEQGLAKQNFPAQEIQALLSGKTPEGAAKFFVALMLKDNRHPKGLSLQTVKSSYSRYLAAKRNS